MKYLLLLLAIYLLPLNALAAAEIEQTKEVWARHIEAWNARDLEAISADYGPNSILILNNVVFSGPGEIREAFRQLFTIFDQGENEIDPPVLEGRVIYITWHFTPRGGAAVDGTDTFLVEKGKITVQTIASRLYEQFPVRK